MTRKSILELAAAIHPRYMTARKAAKKLILDEFCASTGYHRKAAIRLLRRSPQSAAKPARRGRPRVYRPEELLKPLVLAWEAAEYICSKRLAPFMGDLLDSLLRHHELRLDASVYQKLVTMSPATMDRLLRRVRQDRLRRPHVSTPTVASLAHKVATHSFADLRSLPLGHLEMDLVLHCGMSTEGFYLTTLVGVDIVTGWSECVAVWGKGQERVGGGVERVRRRLPFALQGVHSDSGSEFINQRLYDYCHRQQIAFSHSRPYHKNDQPRVEQRNGSLVRQLIGYDRYTSHAAHAQLNRIYELLHHHTNFFQPLRKLIGYERRGAHVVKRYDQAQTPYQRLLATGALEAEKQAELQALYLSLNPLRLQRQIEQEIDRLWQLAAVDPASEQAALARLAADLPTLR